MFLQWKIMKCFSIAINQIYRKVHTEDAKLFLKNFFIGFSKKNSTYIYLTSYVDYTTSGPLQE